LALLPVYGILDDLINPTEGFGLRPDIRVTVPSPLNSVEYARLDIVARGYLPLGPSVGLMGRVSAGSLFPFGKSRVTAETDTLTNYLQLRDAAFVAGGPEDVRGWESRLLGPKIPDVRLSTVNGDTVLSADAYIPVAGAIRVSFSLELRLPFPGLGPSWGTMLFLDGGRVWSPTRSSFAFASPGQEEVYYAVGGGVDFRTPVGALRMSMGYKLNPSELDLRSASDVFKASQTGTPLDQVPTKQSLRWQFNLSLAVAF
jgi:outer membrane protein assembly factor BamA